MSDSSPAGFDSPALLRAAEEFDRGNHSIAVEMLVPLADAGNPKAQCYLANAYQLGLGVEVDGRKAARLYLAVGQQNIREGRLSATAYNNLATLYFVGAPGVERNTERAQEYLTRARELGFEM